MGLDVLKIILLHGIRDDCLDMLNLLGKGDISKEYFGNIVELCKRYSRGSSRNNRRDKQDKLEIGDLLKNFKIEMMSSISSKIDVLRKNQK